VRLVAQSGISTANRRSGGAHSITVIEMRNRSGRMRFHLPSPLVIEQGDEPMTFALQAHYPPEIPPTAGVDSPIILMIDRNRCLLDGTPTGTRMLDEHDLLACEFGRVRASRQHDQIHLERSIEMAMKAGGADLILAGLRVEIVRLGGPASEGRLLLIFRSLEIGTQHVDDAAHYFGLTRAERRLLKLLFEGMSLKSAASSLGVARTTARSHLQRIFDKTGRRRQSDLVRLVALGD
jgi:DNA-binding CsgD family transcriptional regulator